MNNVNTFTEMDWEAFSGSEVFSTGEEPLMVELENRAYAIADGLGIVVCLDYDSMEPEDKLEYCGEVPFKIAKQILATLPTDFTDLTHMPLFRKI